MLSTWSWSSESEHLWAWLQSHSLCTNKIQFFWSPNNIINNNNRSDRSRKIILWFYLCIRVWWHWYTLPRGIDVCTIGAVSRRYNFLFTLKMTCFVTYFIPYNVYLYVYNVKPLEEREMRDFQRRCARISYTSCGDALLQIDHHYDDDDERAKLARWWRKLFGNLM